MILALGDPIEGRRLGIHTIRSLARPSAAEQLKRFKGSLRIYSSGPIGAELRSILREVLI